MPDGSFLVRWSYGAAEQQLPIRSMLQVRQPQPEERVWVLLVDGVSAWASLLTRTCSLAAEIFYDYGWTVLYPE
jgi:hypothetical protein